MNEQPLTNKEVEALRHIRNRIVHGEEPPSVRELQALLGYGSPNSAAYVIARLIERRYLQRRKDRRLQLLKDVPEDRDHARTVLVPLVGSAPCGEPLLAEQNIEARIPVSDRLARPPHRYFLLHAQGDSMNRANIQDGDLVLIRQQTSAENGDRVVALIDDEATIKELRRNGNVVTLRPHSTNAKYQPIILNHEFQIQGVVIETIPDWAKGPHHG